MNLFDYFENLLVKRGKPCDEKIIAGNTVLKRTSESLLSVEFHGRLVLEVTPWSVTVFDGGYGFSATLKKRLNDWGKVSPFPFSVFTSKRKCFISLPSGIFPLVNGFFFVVKNYESVDMWEARLQSLPTHKLNDLMKIYLNCDAYSNLLVALDKVLESR